MCDEGSKETLTIEVEFDANSYLLIKVTMEKLAAALRAYSIARGRKKQNFIQHNKDMNLKVWLALLRHPIVEIHYLTMMV